VSVGHYENFPVASRLVPTRYRSAVVAIYRYARAADDVADEGDAPSRQRLDELHEFVVAIDAIGRGETPTKPPFPEVAAAIRAHDLPLQPFRDLISAFAQDVTTVRYATFADVLDYCRRSANPVGRLLLALYRIDGVDNLAASDSICSGLQLANFWQDIAVDWRKGRVYLPQEDLARFQVRETHIERGLCDEAWRALLRFECARTRAMLDAGRPLVGAMPWRVGLELSAVIAGGRRILQRIDAVQGDVFRRRPQLGAIDWAVVAARALMPPRAARQAAS
jgi:squalene synthase HpnC